MSENAESNLLSFPLVDGVFRRGSPVISADDESEGVVVGARDTANPERMEVYIDNAPFPNDPLSPRWNLNLREATGRAHLAWWLADAAKLDFRWKSTDFVQRFHGERCWSLGAEHSWHGSDDDMMSFLRSDDLVPSLATLDPDDHRLLPDGSRLVDALALSLVARHVAGLDKEPSC